MAPAASSHRSVSPAGDRLRGRWPHAARASCRYGHFRTADLNRAAATASSSAGTGTACACGRASRSSVTAYLSAASQARLRSSGSSTENSVNGSLPEPSILDAMELSPFRIERFYARYEHSTRFMLSSSDCESRTIGALLEFEPGAQERLLETWCGYTEPPGGPELRQAIASLYERTSAQ